MAKPAMAPTGACVAIALLCRTSWVAAAATVDGGFADGHVSGLERKSPSGRYVADPRFLRQDSEQDAAEAGASSGALSRHGSALFDIGSVWDEAGKLAKEAKQKTDSVAGDVAQDVQRKAADLSKEARQLTREAKQKMAAAMQVHRRLLEPKNRVGGHSKAFNNKLLLTLLGVVAVAAAVGHALELLLCSARPKAGGSHGNTVRLLQGEEHEEDEEEPSRRDSEHPRGWVIGMLVASYGMLVPAVQSTLFSFNVFMSLHLDFIGDVGYNLTRHPVTESTLSVVSVLLKTGGHTAAFLVILYAMILPAAKVLLLLAGEFWRNSEDEALRRVSSTCICLVQVVSKWATPDLFAYILLLFLARHLSHPPLIQAEGVLDAGFCCFGVFCLCSTFSTLAIHRPPPPAVELKGPAKERCPTCGRGPEPAPLLLVGSGGALQAIGALEALFAVLLLLGLFTPCMGLHLDSSLLLEPHGPVPRSMAWVLQDAIDNLGLRPLLRAEVSLWHCLVALRGYVAEGEVASLMAFVMLAGFALLLTVADMLLLALATLFLGRPCSGWAMAASRVLKHISMLDVLCMGVFVVCMAGEAYQSVGFDLGLRMGLLPLAGAEVVHYITYYLVAEAVKDCQEGGGGRKSHFMHPDTLLAVE